MKVVEIEKREIKSNETGCLAFVRRFMNQYRGGIAWRVSKHSAIIDRHLNPGEAIRFAFAGQKNDNHLDIITTCVVAITNQRIMIARKSLLFGSSFYSITPDLFNDLEVYEGLLFGQVTIDTVKEEVVVSNLPKSGLAEIETQITSFMMEEKKKYQRSER